MESFAGMKKKRTFATLLKRRGRALSSAGSERLPYKQRVGGSNPSAPTESGRHPLGAFFVFLFMRMFFFDIF